MTHGMRRLAVVSREGLVARAARGYVAGTTLQDALAACRALQADGIACTLAFWDDDGARSTAVAAEYVAAADAVGREGLDCYVSIKPPSLGANRFLLAAVAERCRDAGTGLHFDAVRIEDAGPALDLLLLAGTIAPWVGCTLPARWRRSRGDAEVALERCDQVRVVKGQWEDPEEPDRDSRAGFLEVIDRLAGRAPAVAVASHDAPLVAEALRRLREAGTPCTLELLYGLPCSVPMRVAAEVGVPVRVYVPYGRAWLPYALAQARRRPRILWWIARDALGGRGRRQLRA